MKCNSNLKRTGKWQKYGICMLGCLLCIFFFKEPFPVLWKQQLHSYITSLSFFLSFFVTTLDNETTQKHEILKQDTYTCLLLYSLMHRDGLWVKYMYISANVRSGNVCVYFRYRQTIIFNIFLNLDFQIFFNSLLLLFHHWHYKYGSCKERILWLKQKNRKSQ